ncbi:uncharacterized protein LOC107305430 [Oryza brachyantha]|uniref:uncharacterized protein LOC107305430 n=1 Tax=Oryza brachyantha TaxID=4533 RepID=UPI0007769BBF|nr:uncharacterized protein LOC107305430 [Oryza brachyantha]
MVMRPLCENSSLPNSGTQNLLDLMNQIQSPSAALFKIDYTAHLGPLTSVMTQPSMILHPPCPCATGSHSNDDDGNDAFRDYDVDAAVRMYASVPPNLGKGKDLLESESDIIYFDHQRDDNLTDVLKDDSSFNEDNWRRKQ